jgi:hypothetical protein
MRISERNQLRDLDVSCGRVPGRPSWEMNEKINLGRYISLRGGSLRKGIICANKLNKSEGVGCPLGEGPL